MQGQPSTIILKASMKNHITSSFQSLKERLGAISHMYMPKTSISSRIQKNLKGGPLEFSHYMVKLKGRLLWVQQMMTTWEDPVISIPLN